jgi:hypothetical protein
MVLWLKLMVPWWNWGPSVGAHTWLCYSARAGITVSSYNPLWDYINALSWHNMFFLLREIVIGASSVMVSWLMTYGVAAKLRASCECAHMTVLLVGCWYQGLWSWSIVELHWCVIFRGPSLKQFLCCLSSDQATSIISVGSKGHTPLMCGLLSLDFGGDYTHTSSLYVLCVKVKPWSFLVSRNNWLALKMEICFPCCWDAEVCSFALLFNPCIPGPSQFILHEETGERPDQMDFYPSAWPFGSKMWTLNPWLTDGTERTCSMSKVVQQVGFTNL